MSYLSQRDYLFLYYITFAECMVGLIYIFFLIILISIVIWKYKVKTIRREVNIRVKNENEFRIYERNEEVVINKANKCLQHIHHSHRIVDRINPKESNLLLETIVEINGKKRYSNKKNIENNESLSDSEVYYIRDGFESTTNQLIFDGNGKVIKRLIINEKVEPIQLTAPLTNELIKTEVISAKIPIQIQRNRVTVQKGVTQIDVNTKSEKKTALDVISYGNSSVHSLLVSSQTNEPSIYSADIKPELTSDTLISNVEFNETEALQNDIEIKEIPTLSSHIKIKEIPLNIYETNIKEIKGQSIKSSVETTDIIEAEVPIVVDKVITERRVPHNIPISIFKSKVLQIF